MAVSIVLHWKYMECYMYMLVYMQPHACAHATTFAPFPIKCVKYPPD